MNLTDGEITTEMEAGHLVRNGEPGQIGPACYELRMGRIYYDLTEGARRFDVGAGGKVLIKPGHHVVLITHEELVVPPYIIARIISKGSLFSVGLSPVCTYADPGFSGNLGVVTQNISDKYIELPVGESIAKADFAKLSKPVDHPYQGQHGYQTQIWPIKYHLQKSYAEVSHDPRVEGEKVEAYKLLPRATADLLLAEIAIRSAKGQSSCLARKTDVVRARRRWMREQGMFEPARLVPAARASCTLCVMI
jgi:dCTP deaminase